MKEIYYQVIDVLFELCDVIVKCATKPNTVSIQKELTSVANAIRANQNFSKIFTINWIIWFYVCSLNVLTLGILFLNFYVFVSNSLGELIVLTMLWRLCLTLISQFVFSFSGRDSNSFEFVRIQLCEQKNRCLRTNIKTHILYQKILSKQNECLFTTVRQNISNNQENRSDSWLDWFFVVDAVVLSTRIFSFALAISRWFF